MWSSIHDIVLPSDLLILGEVGLSGELRPIPEVNARIAEAKKQGFNRVILSGRHKINIKDVQLIKLDKIQQLPAVIKKSVVKET